jgi:glutathione synthase/RimK-type ligase-like ATP-grasp enzyme
LRGHGHGIFYTLQYLNHLENLGTRVINGPNAFAVEISKARQLSLLRSLNLPYPKARVINTPLQAVAASENLRFPIVVKVNIGGSGAGIVRFDSRDQLIDTVENGKLDLGLDQTALVQEFIPARDGHITRVETLGGKYLYGIKVFNAGDTFNLCPADICQTTRLRVEAFEPPRDVIGAVERIVKAAQIDVGGVEYMVDDRDGSLLYYDVNALSNFVSDAARVVGFNPHETLVDFLQQEVTQRTTVTRSRFSAVG